MSSFKQRKSVEEMTRLDALRHFNFYLSTQTVSPAYFLPPVSLDMKQGVDMSLHIDIGLRASTKPYWYYQTLAIRKWVRSGNRTEWDKLLAGDIPAYLLHYLVNSNDPNSIIASRLIDFHQLSSQLNEDEDWRERIASNEVVNYDGRSSLVNIPIQDLEDRGLILGRRRDNEEGELKAARYAGIPLFSYNGE